MNPERTSSKLAGWEDWVDFPIVAFHPRFATMTKSSQFWMMRVGYRGLVAIWAVLMVADRNGGCWSFWVEWLLYCIKQGLLPRPTSPFVSYTTCRSRNSPWPSSSFICHHPFFLLVCGCLTASPYVSLNQLLIKQPVSHTHPYPQSTHIWHIHGPDFPIVYLERILIQFCKRRVFCLGGNS